MRNTVKRGIFVITAVSLIATSGLQAFAAPDESNTKVLDEILSGNSTQTTQQLTKGEAVQQTEGQEQGAQTTGETTDVKKEEQATVTAEEEIAIATTTTTTPPTTVNAGDNLTSSTRVKYANMLSSINKHKAVNPEAVAWLYVPNTNMNFTIIKPNSSNTYYEKRSWEGVHYPNNNYTNFKQTATFTDRRVVLGSGWGRSSKNIVLYGHNWTNLRAPYDIGNVARHTMFGQLPSYTSLDFVKKNPYVYFSTDQNEGIWKIFAVAYVENDPSVFSYNTPNPSADKYANMLSEFKQRSIHNFDVDVNTGDRIITLDTCTRNYSGVGSDQRFVVVARLLREGETDTQGVNITKNPKPKYPKF